MLVLKVLVVRVVVIATGYFIRFQSLASSDEFRELVAQVFALLRCYLGGLRGEEISALKPARTRCGYPYRRQGSDLVANCHESLGKLVEAESIIRILVVLLEDFARFL